MAEIRLRHVDTTRRTTHARGGDPLVAVRGLTKRFSGGGTKSLFGRSEDVVAVDGVSFEIWPGETLGLVGESGSGKTTAGRCVLRLVEPTAGEIVFDGQEVTALSRSRLRALRRDMQMIFQDPHASLDPRLRVGDLIAEPMRIHGLWGKEGYDRARVLELLEIVGLSPEHSRRYPVAFSGGERQRIGIARALAVRPKFLVCDEPVSSLDVSIRAQIVNLLMDLQEEFQLTYLFIAHDLALVRHICDRVAVMSEGKIVELADCDALYANPQHPYTRALLDAVPVPDPAVERRRPTGRAASSEFAQGLSLGV
jgi:oligopeptide transport system ATP-binding protein